MSLSCTKYPTELLAAVDEYDGQNLERAKPPAVVEEDREDSASTLTFEMEVGGFGDALWHALKNWRNDSGSRKRSVKMYTTSVANSRMIP